MDKLTSAIATLRGLLTPANRKAIYVILGAVGALAVTFGHFSDAQVADVIGKVGAVLDSLALLLIAAPHTDTSTASGMPSGE